jgi:hypothetical protein
VRRTGTGPASRRRVSPGGRRVAIVSSAAVLLAGIGLVVSLAPGWGRDAEEFVVSAIDVRGNTILTDEEVVALSGLSHGESLLGVGLADVEEEIGRSSRIGRARASRRLPGTIVITLDENLPAALIADGSGGFAEVTDARVVLECVELSPFVDLPFIGGTFGPVEAGAELDSEELALALELLSLMKQVSQELWAEVSEVRIAPGSGLIIYTVADGAEVRVGSGALGTSGLRDLWLVMCDLRARGLTAESIDLRFDGQLVVKLSPGTGGERA